MRSAVIEQSQTQWTVPKRDSIDRRGHDATSELVGIGNFDRVLRRVEPHHHLEARPCLRNTRVEMQDVTLKAQAEDALDAGSLHPSARASVPSPAAAPDMGRCGIDIGSFPDREVIAKAEGRFAKADKQRASIKTDPKKATQREQARVEHVKQAKKAPKRL
jgi:hypothetical protein